MNRKLKIALFCLGVFGFVACGLNDDLSEVGGDGGGPDGGDDTDPEVMEVTFIDVGQGDACLFELPDGTVMLVDGGDDGYGDSAIIPILDDKGITVIDLMVLTHPHADHCGGLDEVIDHVDVLEIWENGETLDTYAYNRFVLARDSEGAEVVYPVDGDLIFLGEVSINVLGTFQGYEGENNDSLVLKISYGDVGFLMTGDIESEEQLDEMSHHGSLLQSDVLKVPHHGSFNFHADFPFFVNPDHAVISSGAGNIYGHPHQECIDAYEGVGAVVYRTDLEGDILVWTDGTTLEVGNF